VRTISINQHDLQSRPVAEQRTILVAVAGGSPAIVTETLWALTQQRGERVDEVRVITTSKGEKAIRAALLDPASNKVTPGVSRFADCCSECGLPPTSVSFSIHTLTGPKGLALADIRDDKENQTAADQICALIQDWTSESNTKIYCSAAGGRKTMSIYLTIAMMIYGRTDDRLFHVLVEPEEAEHCREFFYPYRKPRTFTYIDNSGKRKKFFTKNARIDLGEIPFVKLRILETPNIFGQYQNYSEIVSAVQDRLDFFSRAASAAVHIRRLQAVGNRIPIEVAGKTCYMETGPGLIYAMVAWHRITKGTGLSPLTITSEDLKSVYRMLSGQRYTDGLQGTDLNFLFEWIDELSRGRASLVEGFKKNFQVNVSRANRALREANFPKEFRITNLKRALRGKASEGAAYTIEVAIEAIHLPG
jgi:CRISPR-associated protein (TIGR02584 family)